MQTIQKKDNNKTKEQILINEIKQKVSVMKKSQFRTTNFSLIEYFAENDCKPLNQDALIVKLLLDYKDNPKKYVLSNDRNSSFKCEKNFKSSIILSISRNKAFVKGPGEGELSLNLEKTVQYLKTMYRQYTNNSSNIHTPYKIFNPKNNKNRNVQSTVKGIKKENNTYDVVNMEIEEQKEKSKNKNKNVEKYQNNNINNNHSFNIYFNQPQDELGRFKNESNGKNSPISISNSTYSFSSNNDLKKENKKDIPDIFQQRLNCDLFIESLKNEKISHVLIDFNNYLLDVKAKKMNDQIEKEIEKIKNILQNIYDAKKNYDSHCIEIKNWQSELLTIYKIMSNQLKTLKIEINIKSYSYEVYVQLRDIILKYESYYNNITDTIKLKLEELKELIKELKDNRKYILNCMNTVHKTIGFCDFNFSRLSRSIEQVLKIGNFASINCSDYDDDDNNIKDIIKRLREEKKEIIDEINGIDKYIGNITID